jgi:hypothetical protein
MSAAPAASQAEKMTIYAAGLILKPRIHGAVDRQSFCHD